MPTPVTSVINIKTNAGPFDVYIGRNGSYNDHVSRCPLCQRRPLNLCSEGLRLIWYGNPFYIGVDGNRAQVLEKFEAYARARIEKDPSYRGRVKKMFGKILGCFCDPLPCHGSVYVILTEELNG